jgi:crotonobetainyl-CoA:carnitine CoA-transferase CaiB-like acyl-CoA transferase
MKDSEDIALIHKLIAKADVLIHNFRPDVMSRHGLDHASIVSLNPRIVYAEISGYGKKGPWKDKPGQDLLVQAMSGLAYTTGNGTGDPVPFGISIGDILSGSQLVQGILAALIRRNKTGQGALIEVSMLESLLDFQFELLTTYYRTRRQPERSALSNGQPLLSAPYGVYKTRDGYISLSMMDIHQLADSIGCVALKNFRPEDVFSRRDEIKQVLADFLRDDDSAHWLELLHGAGLWSMPVLNWNEMTYQDAYRVLHMEQSIVSGEDRIITTRCPIRFDGKILFSERPAPLLGEHTELITGQFVDQN